MIAGADRDGDLRQPPQRRLPAVLFHQPCLHDLLAQVRGDHCAKLRCAYDRAARALLHQKSDEPRLEARNDGYTGFVGLQRDFRQRVPQVYIEYAVTHPDCSVSPAGARRCRRYIEAKAPSECSSASSRPSSTITPSSMTMTRSERCTVVKRWATMKTVHRPRSSLSASCTRVSAYTSSALVASSSTRMSGLRSIARASAIRCRCPPERPTPRSPMGVA